MALNVNGLVCDDVLMCR